MKKISPLPLEEIGTVSFKDFGVCDMESKQAACSEELRRTTNEIESMSTQLNLLVDNLKKQLCNGELNTDDGISLLDVKNQLMLNYLTNVTYIIAKKIYGKPIENDEAIDRLVEIRTVLERIRPIEHKLKYMMDKLVKTAITGVRDSNDPTNFRANPQNMIDNMDGSDSESDEEEEKTTGKKVEKKSGIYVPPKLTPMHYDEDENPATRRQKQLDRAKKRALHSSVIEELKDEYLDTPTEVSHGNMLRANISKHQKHKNQYEEEYFTRLPSSKKEKHKGRHSMTVGNIANQLTHFDNIEVLENEESFSGPAKRKRKSGGKSGGKSKKTKGFKRRKTH